MDPSLKFWGKWMTYSRKRTVEDAVLRLNVVCFPFVKCMARLPRFDFFGV